MPDGDRCPEAFPVPSLCLLYTSDAADDMQCVDLGGRRIIKKIFFKQKTAYEMLRSLVGSEMCIRDRSWFFTNVPSFPLYIGVLS